MLIPVLLDSTCPFSACLLPDCHWLPPHEHGWKIIVSLIPVYLISSKELICLQDIVTLCQPWVLTYHSCALSMLAGSTSLLSTSANPHTLFYVKTSRFFWQLKVQPLYNYRFNQCLQNVSHWGVWKGEEVLFTKAWFLKFLSLEACSELCVRSVRHRYSHF